MKLALSPCSAFLSLALLASPAAAVVPARNLELPAPDSTRVLSDIRQLASERFAGRRTGEAGCDSAAAWLARQFAALGLRPAGDSGTYLQHFEATVGVSPGTRNFLRTHTAAGDQVWRPDSDFCALGFSENNSVVGARVVFAGYGITAEDKGYDDYAGLEARDRVVMILRQVPAGRDSTGPFGLSGRSRYADLRYKAGNAVNHGARALLVVLGPASEGEDQPLRLRMDEGIGGAHIPVMSITRKVAESLLGAGELARLQAAMDSTRKPAPRALDRPTVDLRTDLLRDRRRVANVVGVLPAPLTDAHETVLLGAHYDHLGMGGAGSLEPDRKAIHFGADDNASGTVGVLELARTFVAARWTLRRDLMFVCFVGEEEGLFGSSYFANHPPVPLERVSAMVNMDMIGRLHEDRIFVAGTGSSAAFPALLERAAAQWGLKFASQASGYGPSDHTSFYAKDRPVLFFFTGAHADYHKPSDTWDRIEHRGEARVLGMVQVVLADLAGRDSTVAFTRVVADSAQGKGGGEGYGGGGYGPYLGTVPDFGDNPDSKGVLLSGVREGSPAEKAGIHPRDTIIEFDGRPIGNLYDYTYALRAHKPGDEVEIEVLREGVRLKVRAVLGRRNS